VPIWGAVCEPIDTCDINRHVETDTLQQQLVACIKAALEQHRFAKPNTPDTSIIDAYSNEATAALIRQLQAAGRVLVKGLRRLAFQPRHGAD
jgi:hypothetical protein